MKPIVFYLVRHGRTLFNEKELVQGWCDSMLTQTGRDQADAVGRGLHDVPFAAAFTGGLGRQRETAKRILAQNDTSADLPLLENEGLLETGFGGYEGDPNMNMWQPILDSFGLDFEHMRDMLKMIPMTKIGDYIRANDPTGTAESSEESAARCRKGMLELVDFARSIGGGNILAVSSGASIGVLLETLLPDFRIPYPVQNCSVTRLGWDSGKFSMIEYNNQNYVNA